MRKEEYQLKNIDISRLHPSGTFYFENLIAPLFSGGDGDFFPTLAALKLIKNSKFKIDIRHNLLTVHTMMDRGYE